MFPIEIMKDLCLIEFLRSKENFNFDSNTTKNNNTMEFFNIVNNKEFIKKEKNLQKICE
jgi:hypothetical protein